MWLLIAALVLGRADMAAINHFSAQTTANQDTTSVSYVDVTNASLAASSFVAGKKYLLLAYAQIGASVIDEAWIRMVHGSTPTAFDDSEQIQGYSANERSPYWWWTVWTAPTPAELVKLQFRSEIATTTASINFAFLLAINLSDDVAENTDWFYGESATDLALTTTYQDGGSVTFTPGTAGQDWLVFTMAQISNAATNQSSKSRINLDGTTLLPETFVENSTRTGCQPIHSLGHVYALTAASHTIKEQAAETGADHTRLHSRVFALNLAKFKNHVSEFTAGPTSYSATDYATLLESAAITPDVTGDVWIGGAWIHDRQNATRETEFRLQKNNADAPAGQTTANYQFDFGTDATDEQPMSLHTMEALTASTLYTFDLDASADATTGTPEAQEISLWAITMELAGAGPQTISPTAISSAEVFGAAKILLAIVGQAIATAEVFGAAVLRHAITPAGIASGEAHGASRVNVILRLAGLASGEAFGPAALRFTMFPVALPSGEAFGAATVTIGGLFIQPDGIASGQVVPNPTLNLRLFPGALASGEAFGALRLRMYLLPAAIASGQALGAATVLPGVVTIQPSGIVTAELFGTAALHRRIVPVGILSAETLGAFRMLLALRPGAIASAEAFGGAIVLPGGVLISPTGIVTAEGFGVPSVFGVALDMGAIVITGEVGRLATLTGEVGRLATLTGEVGRLATLTGERGV